MFKSSQLMPVKFSAKKICTERKQATIMSCCRNGSINLSSVDDLEVIVTSASAFMTCFDFQELHYQKIHFSFTN